MKRIRMALLAAFTIVVLFNIFQMVLPMVLQAWQPIDDWAYKAQMVEPSPQSLAPFWILGFWFFLECARLVWLFNAFSIAIIFITIAVLASVAGPMIGSITDQGRHSADMGFSAGGAKDVANFRQNIARGYLPQVSDLTFEGLFYDYSFDMTSSRARPRMPENLERKLFSPSYSCAVSRNPLTGEDESYLAVGLESDFGLDEISRKQLNLVVVLDISASMDSSFSDYYYDRNGRNSRYSNGQEPGGEDPMAKRSKLEIACRSITALIDHLRPEDRLGIVLFDDEAYLAKPLRRIGETNVAALKQHILELRTGGCTNMEAGLTLGTSLLEPFSAANPDDVENRVVFLTDAMPNRSETGEDGLLEITRTNAQQRRHLTFIGIGVDFNSQLIKSITRIRGANYFSVHSARDFKRRLDDEFELMVTPLVFDLALKVEAEGFAIERVYGSPEADQASGRLMYVNTLFPSKRDETGARGGIILLKLRRLPGAVLGSQLALTAAYEDRAGQRHAVRSEVDFPTWSADQYENTGIRKGILLARYGDLIHDWICRERGINLASTNREDFLRGLGRWERSSTPLSVSAANGERFRLFHEAFERERMALGDPALAQEDKIFDHLGLRVGVLRGMGGE